MWRAAALAMILPLAAPLAAQEIRAPTLEANADGEIRALGVRLDARSVAGTPPVLWSEEISVADADYIRLFLRVEGAAFAPDAELVVIPRLGEREVIGLAGIGAEGRWTGVLHFGRARLTLRAAGPIGDAVLVLDSLAVQTGRSTLYSTHGRNDLMPINAGTVPEALRRHAASVAILYFIEGGKPRTCTGFLTAPDRLVTNEHCINSEQACRSMTAVFGYEVGPDHRMRIGPSSGCAGHDDAQVNFALDASVVRLSRPPGPDYPPIALTPAPPPDGDLYIIQHPDGQAKQVSFVECRALERQVDGRAPQTDFAHSCDTAGGSSGSPIFDMTGNLVGLHHFGFKEDGEGIWTANRGVHADLISRWIAPPPEGAADHGPDDRPADIPRHGHDDRAGTP